MPTSEEYKEQQREQWNEFSPGWKKWDRLVMGAFQDQGAEIVKEMKGVKGHILDVATGTGELGLTLAEESSDRYVSGVDLSEGMAWLKKKRKLGDSKTMRLIRPTPASCPFQMKPLTHWLADWA